MMSLLAIVNGPIYVWLGGIYFALVSTFGQTIGGILGLPIAWLGDLIWPFGL